MAQEYIYDPMQSLSVNLEKSGLAGRYPLFDSALQTGFAKAGMPGYGGETAFNLIRNADPNRANDANALSYANELLQQQGISGFANTQELSAANTALPGHSGSEGIGGMFSHLGDTASGLASNPGFRALALTAAGGAALGSASGAGGAAGGTGITGTVAPSGAFTGPGAGGLTGGISTTGAFTGPGAGGLTAAAPAGTALAPGFFASEAAVPSSGGSLAPTGGSSGGPSTTGGLSLSQIAAGALPAAFGAYGANQQANQYGALANQYMAMGAPYRSRLSELYENPEDWLNSAEVQIPIQQSTDILARSLSTKGNPAGSGNALQELQNYSAKQLFDRLGQEKDRLAGFGGLSYYNQAAPGAAGAEIGAQKGVYDAIGAGAADIFNPPRRYTLQDLMRNY